MSELREPAEPVRSFRLSPQEHGELITAMAGRQNQIPAQRSTAARDTSDTSVPASPPPPLPAAAPAPVSSLAQQLLDVFLEEAAELLDSLHRSLELLEQQRSGEAVAEARRAIHTIKGGARMCGFRSLTDLAHACEDLIGPASPPATSLPPPAIALLFDAELEMRAALQRPVEGPGSDAAMATLAVRLRGGNTVTASTALPQLGRQTAPVAASQPVTARLQVPAAAQSANEETDAETASAAAVTHAPFEAGPPETPEISPPPSPASVAAIDLPGHASLAAQLLEVFVEETGEMLDILHTCLEKLERTPDEAAMVEARRAMHTIKGGARMCGRGSITDLAHACEDLIGRPAPGRDSLSPAVLGLLFEAEQDLRAALAPPAEGPGSDESVRALIARLRTAPSAPPETAPAQPPPTVAETTIPTRPAEPRAVSSPPKAPKRVAAQRESASVAPQATARARDDSAGDVGTPVREQEPTPSIAQAPAPRRPASPASGQNNRLAVDMEKVEALVAKVTEIVANRASSHGLVEMLGNAMTEMSSVAHRMQTIAIGLQYQISSRGLDTVLEHDANGLDLETYGPIRQLLLQLQEAAADQQALVQNVVDVVARKRALAAVEARLDTDLQGTLLNMRLLPLSQLRVRLDQVVRSSAAAAGREVRWTMEGQEVALDKHVCDRLFEPLMHVLRNSVDHGIEPPEEREALGKPRAGRIAVRAVVEGNQAVVTIGDDGRGIDPERIAQTAVTRGLLSAESVQGLSPREKLDLVFLPGFSTAATVTELSGRGMGMEIVREACTRMGGTVTIARREGGGTVVVLRVPLSMSVVHCMVVRDSDRLLAIPATQIVSVHLVTPGAVSLHDDGGYHMRIGSAHVPLFFLPGSRPPAAEIAGALEERIALLVPYRSDRVAVIVDEIVEEEDQIVKPLPFLLQGVDRLLGAIMLSDGTPVPVLNLPPTLDRIGHQKALPAAPAAECRGERVVLVVDDSLTMRLALMQTLEHAGFTVETARDGQEALEYVRTSGMPSLVTMDIEMPRMDGLEALYAIRHTPGGETVPIFMLSSRSGRKHLRAAEKLGATRYFTKPYHDTEFVAAARAATTDTTAHRA